MGKILINNKFASTPTYSGMGYGFIVVLVDVAVLVYQRFLCSCRRFPFSMYMLLVRCLLTNSYVSSGQGA